MKSPHAAPKNIDAYLATVSADKRAALEKLRKDIQAAAPQAAECIAYQVPSFRLDGKHLVSFGAGAKHCAFYPGAVIEDFERELEGYDTSKGTIRYPADEPLPAALVRKLVRARVARIVADKPVAKSAGRPRKKAPVRRR